MEDDSFFPRIKTKLVASFQSLEKNSVAIGVVFGVGSTLALGLLVPDTTKTFLDEVRGHRRRRHSKPHDAIETSPESFTTRLENSGQPEQQAR